MKNQNTFLISVQATPSSFSKAFVRDLRYNHNSENKTNKKWSVEGALDILKEISCTNSAWFSMVVHYNNILLSSSYHYWIKYLAAVKEWALQCAQTSQQHHWPVLCYLLEQKILEPSSKIQTPNVFSETFFFSTLGWGK